MTTILEKRFFNRSDTAVNWFANNPVLGAGEIGFETDSGFFKFGNGISTYSQLPYASAGGSGGNGNLDGGTPTTTGSGSVDGGTP